MKLILTHIPKPYSNHISTINAKSYMKKKKKKKKKKKNKKKKKKKQREHKKW